MWQSWNANRSSVAPEIMLYTTCLLLCCCCSVTQLCLTLCNPMECSMGFPGESTGVGCHRRLQHARHCTISRSLLKLMSIESVMPSNHLILCCPLLLPLIFASIRVFSDESALCISWPKYWNFSSSSSPFNEYSGLISFRIDWFDLLVVQRALESSLYHSAKV